MLPPGSPEPKHESRVSAESGHGQAASSGETEPRPAGAQFPIVGIGASAGGLEALEGLTRRLSSDGMAFIVVQHLAPRQESVLTEILARGTPMTVVTIRDGLRVEPNTIYVTPPDAEISLQQGVLHLAPASGHVPRHTIDAFLQSLADDASTMAIGVILSGAGTDGTLGLRAIKEEGGITFVQEPATASQPSMPQSAIDAGCADFCISPAAIGDELMRLSAHPFVAKQRPPDHLDAETLRRSSSCAAPSASTSRTTSSARSSAGSSAGWRCSGWTGPEITSSSSSRARTSSPCSTVICSSG